jgi:hypothetical protein
MNPNLLDPGPLLEGCDPWHCTDRAGGDHAPTCEVMRCRMGDILRECVVHHSPMDYSTDRYCQAELARIREDQVQCWLCKRWFGRNDATWVPTVFSDGEIGTTCDTCYERGQEAVIVAGLDMMGDDDAD